MELHHRLALEGGGSGQSRGRRYRQVRRATAPVNTPLVPSRSRYPRLGAPLDTSDASASGSPFCPIEDAIEAIRRGEMVVVCDSPDRENEGDLCMAAELVTPDAINFMATNGRGLICLTLTPERCDELGLRLMVSHNQSPYETAFTVSIEAREGIETGISA